QSRQKTVKLLPEIPEPNSAPPALTPVSLGDKHRVRVTPPGMKPDSAVREDLEDRDPNNLNQHIQIVWDDIVGEPEGARSPECAWRLSHICFKYARNWCYTLLAVLAAPPCALLLGCGFACLAFEQIWCTTPCLRCFKIYWASLRTLVQSFMAATLAPIMEACGHVCRHIRVNVRRDAQEDRDLLIV
ncbi:caveolin-3-like, partial [Melitaea cinxia]|uniref:caveolin-3-like n=1 Tax=Melitaea cinxia TaxID=113334 RepID=UPI001E2735BC